MILHFLATNEGNEIVKLLKIQYINMYITQGVAEETKKNYSLVKKFC